MIFGTGVDIIEIERIKQALIRTRGFSQKIFTDNEQNYCEKRKKGKYQSYAARFAAKEAFLKSLGTGYRNGMTFREIEIQNDTFGKPIIKVYGKVKSWVEKEGITRIHVSLSHNRLSAIAFVLLEKDEEGT